MNKFLKDKSKEEAKEYLFMFIVWLSIVALLGTIAYVAFISYGYYFLKGLE